MNTKSTVLIIEDDASLREIMVYLMQIEGYRVLEAENGLHALEMLVRSDSLPDLIVLDLKMPILDGRTFLNLINDRYKETLGKIPVIINSAYGVCDNHPQVYTRMDKPVELELFLKKIQECLSGKEKTNSAPSPKALKTLISP